MLSRLHRMSAGMVRFLFRQHLVKIHAPHMMARVFFLPTEQDAPEHLKKIAKGPHFAVLLTRGSYKNSVEMHARRRAVYNALGHSLAEYTKLGTIMPHFLSGVLPKESFFTLTRLEQQEAASALLDKFFSSGSPL